MCANKLIKKSSMILKIKFEKSTDRTKSRNNLEI